MAKKKQKNKGEEKCFPGLEVRGGQSFFKWSKA